MLLLALQMFGFVEQDRRPLGFGVSTIHCLDQVRLTSSARQSIGKVNEAAICAFFLRWKAWQAGAQAPIKKMFNRLIYRISAARIF